MILTPHLVNDEHRLDDIPGVTEGLGDVCLHCAHHTEPFCMTWKTAENNPPH